MNNYKDYLSEFEREFETNDSSSEYDGENGVSEEYEDELENDFSNESDQKLDSNNEYESDQELDTHQEYELDNEYELESELQDSESENYLQEYSSPDQEFEDRLYSVLNGEHESSFEMEQEIDRVLHEMEVEYFWKAAKNAWKKHKNKIMPFAKHLIPGGSLASLGKFAASNLRGVLKNDLIRKGLTMAGNAYLPGVGGAVVGGLLNRETPNANDARAQAGQAVKVAKDAYQNMAGLIPNLRPGNIPNQISRFSKQAVGMAQKRHSVYKGKTKQVVRIKPNSIVVVRPDRVIIYS
jgi:hypothetical protein